MELPQLAFEQIRSMILSFTDRILVVPSPWQISLQPILMWLGLHRDDGICQVLLNEEVR